MSLEKIPFITKFISLAKQTMYTPKPVKDKNKFKVKLNPTYEADKQVNQGKMTPEQLEEHWKAQRGTGAHVNPKDKRSKNPYKGDWD